MKPAVISSSTKGRVKWASAGDLFLNRVEASFAGAAVATTQS